VIPKRRAGTGSFEINRKVFEKADGRVLAFHDTVVTAPEFVPPGPLAEHRAKVTVRLNAICGVEMSGESVATFVIDTSALCKLDAIEADAAGVKWQPVEGARSYEVRAYRLADGRVLASQETREPAARLALKEAAVVSVRPACAAGLPASTAWGWPPSFAASTAAAAECPSVTQRARRRRESAARQSRSLAARSTAATRPDWLGRRPCSGQRAKQGRRTCRASIPSRETY